MDYTKILIKPLITEKTTFLKDQGNQVAFIVDRKANKIDIKKAVENAFKVKVSKVRVVNKRPRVKKRFGRVVGKLSGYKKAYVQLAPGEKIDFFEGV
ncbi:50S ribosomal protein L23 [Desulfothermus okinawensis JCM 13304]